VVNNGNANQNETVISLHSSQNGYPRTQTTNAGKDVGGKELLYTIGMNTIFLKKLNTIQSSDNTPGNLSEGI
jgi:hypothetical protein